MITKIKKIVYIVAIGAFINSCSEKSNELDPIANSYTNIAVHNATTYSIANATVLDFGLNQDNYLDQDVVLKDTSGETIAYLDLKAITTNDFIGDYAQGTSSGAHWLDIVELKNGSTKKYTKDITAGIVKVEIFANNTIAISYDFSDIATGKTYKGDYKGSYTVEQK